ncbi:MAG: glycosyltransferase family 2 protein [Chloroflexota bacterium]|nr:glycosyltransferase family 2 protein [Chloroflexota bacterium]
MTKVDLVIPTLNGSEILARCLDALRQSTFTDFTVLVFDDGSTEPIAPVVYARFPDARIIRSDRNVGLARAFNLAIRKGDSEYVVLLNNDTEVEPDWLAQLVACADRHPWAGSIASKLRLLSDRHKLHSAGDSWSVRGMPVNRGVWLDDVGQYDREGEVFAACGGAALYRRAAFDDLRNRDGFVFDERLFMYCEDVDLAWRLQTAGWPCVFAPRAVVYHALSATGGGTLASYFVARNVWLVIAGNVPDVFVRPYRARITAYHAGRLVRTVRHLREPAARASLRGTIAGIVQAGNRRKIAREMSSSEIQRIAGLLAGQANDLSVEHRCYTSD